MSFAAPLLLLGLLLAGVPIAIHLINRRRAVRRVLPTIEFLRRSEKKLARALRLKQWLLLALRIALFVLLPLAMARPFLVAQVEGGAGDARLPAAVVIVVDDSASMTRTLDGSNAWEAARNEAIEAVRELRAWDQVAVIFAGDTSQVSLGTLSDQHTLALDVLREHTPRFGGGDLRAALLSAREILATTRQPARRTIVITDNAAHAWASPATTPLTGLGAIELVQIGEGSPSANLAVRDVRWERSPEGGADAWQVEADVVLIGEGEQADTSVSLMLDGERVATTLVTLQGGRGVASFVHRFGDTTGSIPFAVEVEDTVGVAADNLAWGLINERQAARVLLVNGDPRSVQFNDELFFLQRALEAPLGGRASVTVSTIAPSALQATELDAYDVVVLANIDELDPLASTALQAYVRAGGGVLLTVGERTDAARWNATMEPLLPRPMRDVRRLAGPTDRDLGIRATRIAAVDTTHPIFRVFSLPGGETLQSGLVWQYGLVDPQADDTARTIASFGDGAPLLMERPIGSGSVLLWLTTIDSDWNDLPVRTAYLPLMHRMVDYLARRGGGGAAAVVGQRTTIALEARRAPRVAVDSPNGTRQILVPADGETTVSYAPDVAGIHRVFVDVAGTFEPAAELDLVAGPPQPESELAVFDADALTALQASAAEGTASVEQARSSGRTLWPMLLFFVLVVLYVETAVSARRRVWERLRARWRPQPG